MYAICFSQKVHSLRSRRYSLVAESLSELEAPKSYRLPLKAYENLCWDSRLQSDHQMLLKMKYMWVVKTFIAVGICLSGCLS